MATSQNCIQGSIYEKIISLSPQSRSYIDQGSITTMLSNDARNIAQSFGWFHYVLVVPVQLIAYTVLIILELSWVGIFIPLLIVII